MAQSGAISVSGCRSADALAVMSADKLPALLGTPVNRIGLLSYREKQLSPIRLQIDQRDGDGRYLLDDKPEPGRQLPVLGPNDEIVFRLADRGTRYPANTPNSGEGALVEIEVIDAMGGPSGWVYAVLSSPVRGVSGNNHMTYETAADRVESGIYKIGFSPQHPFIIDSFQWRTPAGDWTPNLLDTMKIRHQGKMFGFISFRRTTRDYSSRLTRVKVGPLRVIRRTENRVRIMWKLKTPTLYIDYIMMPDSFVMDTIVNIPFNLGLFFSDVETLTTVDWRNDPALPEQVIRSPYTTSSLRVDGQMSAEESRFNTINGTHLSVHSDYGSVSLGLDIPEDFSIQPWLYLRDRMDVVDPPENQPGQFGNVGYRTTGWESIDTEVHHLKITTCMAAAEAGSVR